MFRFFRAAASRLRSALSPGRVDDDFAQELSAHLEMLTEENVRRGLSREEAGRQARIRLGGVTQLVETNRDQQRLPMIETLLQDLRYARRMMRRKPAFASIAVLTLALGIGANTAIFSVVNAVFLRPLPFPDADRLYVVRRIDNPIGGSSLSMPIFIAWQERRRFFDHLALFGWTGPVTLTARGEPERLASAGASTELLSVLGVHPALGRDFRPEEGRPGGPHVVILSDPLWRNRFQADTRVVGTSVTLDGVPFTIIGVLPRQFDLPIPGAPKADLWLPIRVPVASSNPSNGGLLCLGLLKPGVSPSQAEAALTPPLSQLRRQFPDMFSPHERAYLQPLRSFIASRAGTAHLLIFGAVALVLLVACANLANLTLAASVGRQREIAVRTAMGAGRRRIARQLLTESVLLAVVGGLVGVAACYALFHTILWLVPADLPHVGEIRIDATVLVFASLLSVVTGILFGLVPALVASRLDLNATLKTAGPRSGSGGHDRFRRALAANEVAISLVLLIGAALALESLGRLMSVRPGFDAARVLTFHVEIPNKTYDTQARRMAFFDQALARASALPGVEQAAVVSVLPLLGGPDMLFSIEGASPAQGQRDRGDANIRVVSTKYFSALRIPLDRGRTFSESDNAADAPVTIVNRTLAKIYWAGRDPIGQRIWIGKPMGPDNAEPAPRQIVGIVDDVREESLAEPPAPTMYIPYAQSRSANGGYFVLRTRRAPLLSVPDARAAIRAIDPDLPLAEVRAMEDVVLASAAGWRSRAILLGGFGALALAIAIIGVYGVIAYSVAQRTQEIGVRLALGARHRDVLGLVLWQGMRTSLAGIAIGLTASYGVTRLMTNLLYGVTATDPLTFAGVATLLALVALIACYIPARRAMQVDPLVALRCE